MNVVDTLMHLLWVTWGFISLGDSRLGDPFGYTGWRSLDKPHFSASTLVVCLWGYLVDASLLQLAIEALLHFMPHIATRDSVWYLFSVWQIPSDKKTFLYSVYSILLWVHIASLQRKLWQNFLWFCEIHLSVRRHLFLGYFAPRTKETLANFLQRSDTF